MARLEGMAAWFCNCLGIALVVASILVVPANAFANAGCGVKCGSDPTCLAGCCSDQCSGDPDCEVSCCVSNCGGDPTCEASCEAQAKPCKGVLYCIDTSCNLIVNYCSAGFQCDRIFTNDPPTSCDGCNCVCVRVNTITNKCTGCGCAYQGII
jgi:hypothetical protein